MANRTNVLTPADVWAMNCNIVVRMLTAQLRAFNDEMAKKQGGNVKYHDFRERISRT